MTTSVFNVAEYILERQAAAGERRTTAMKLQKLCYYAQAWHLAWEGTPLFPERIEAWASGPVIPALYEAHRGVFSLQPGDIRNALRDPEIAARVRAEQARPATPMSEAPMSETPAPTETEILRRTVEDALHVSVYTHNAEQRIRAILRDGLDRANKEQP